jgi:GNAT superfamily N-acetyltransferase
LSSGPPIDLTFAPLTPERWADLETLFGPRGACGGCWCMVWRLGRSEWERGKGEGNRHAFKGVVDAGERPGVIAYAGGVPAGWCAVAPRDTYPALSRSLILKPVDDSPVWSISCLFVARSYRRQGLTTHLLVAAFTFAVSRGATIVEGYPVEPRGPDMPAAFAWTGIASAFRDAGFVEVARRSESRPIMRRTAP